MGSGVYKQAFYQLLVDDNSIPRRFGSRRVHKEATYFKECSTYTPRLGKRSEVKLKILGKATSVCRIKSSPHPSWKEVKPSGHVKRLMTALHMDGQFTDSMSLT